MNMDLSEAERLIDESRGKRGVLIPLLQRIQEVYGYVPKEAVSLVAKGLSVAPVDVYGVLTFYTQFKLTPRGRHTIRVCQGTACHVMGGKDLLDYLAETLGVRVGETTADGEYTLDRVACLGCCGMAPVLAIDDDFHGRFTIQELDALLKKYRTGVTA
jgi:NADH-quinone oxidoreductase subunit E